MSKDDTIWKALADPTRRHLLDELRDGPRTTGELVATVPELGRTGVMKHLDLLEEAGLLIVRREGRFRHNFINPVPIAQIYERWVSRYVGRHATAMLKLKRLAEQEVANTQRRREAG